MDIELSKLHNRTSRQSVELAAVKVGSNSACATTRAYRGKPLPLTQLGSHSAQLQVAPNKRMRTISGGPPNNQCETTRIAQARDCTGQGMCVCGKECMNEPGTILVSIMLGTTTVLMTM